MKMVVKWQPILLKHLESKCHYYESNRWIMAKSDKIYGYAMCSDVVWKTLHTNHFMFSGFPSVILAICATNRLHHRHIYACDWNPQLKGTIRWTSIHDNASNMICDVFNTSNAWNWKVWKMSHTAMKDMETWAKYVEMNKLNECQWIHRNVYVSVRNDQSFDW